VIELKNFHIGINDIARDFLEYIEKSRKITINTFKTSFLMKMCDLDEVCSAERNKLIQI